MKIKYEVKNSILMEARNDPDTIYNNKMLNDDEKKQAYTAVFEKYFHELEKDLIKNRDLAKNPKDISNAFAVLIANRDKIKNQLQSQLRTDGVHDANALKTIMQIYNLVQAQHMNKIKDIVSTTAQPTAAVQKPTRQLVFSEDPNFDSVQVIKKDKKTFPVPDNNPKIKEIEEDVDITTPHQSKYSPS